MLNFAELEEHILKRWRGDKTFEKSLERRKNAPLFVFYEGPPTANGRPGIHHVLARVYKDIICRYKTMTGFFVSRKAGWDTHGLPVELEVEKQLGLKSKKDIEAYGIGAFNKKCKESVWTYKDEWEKLTERIGFWLDMQHPYITYEPKYMETLWRIIKQIWKKKLLYRGHRVVPYCARCGTGLSSHEVAQGYKEVTENSVYVKFKLEPGQRIGKDSETGDKTFILSWTTTPWTLPGNVALAVGEDVEYVMTDADKGNGREQWILAKQIHEKPNSISQLANIISRGIPGTIYDRGTQIFMGSDLVGLSYEPLFDISALNTPTSHKVYAADFVTTTDGTGVVHTAVMYGEDDYNLGVAVGLPQHHTVDEQGKFTEDVKKFEGLPVKAKETEEKILEYLKNKNTFLKNEPYTHDYPFCWRCDSPLLYYAKPSWLIAMSKLREKLIENSSTVHWVPPHIKDGRFGEWLREVKDWNLSRERYWGTPLPVWECETCGAQACIGSLTELDVRAYKKSGNTYYLVRHAQATSNLPPRTISHDIEEDKKNPAPLTEFGRKQATDAAEAMRGLGIDMIVSSDFIRTRQTAEILAQKLEVPMVFNPLLRELDHGHGFHGKTVEEYLAAFNGGTAKPDRFTQIPLSGGETLNRVRGRMMRCIQELEAAYTGKRIVLVSHGDPLWMLEMAALLKTDTEEMERLRAATYIQNAEHRLLPYKNLPYDEDGYVNLHRPYIDEFYLKCEVKRSLEPVKGRLSHSTCGGKMTRVKEVVDAWFDSGAMPFAQKPLSAISYQLSAIEEFPADYICEAIDQTRGWFYTLLAVSTLLEKGAPYKNVISLSHVLDAKGQKMSKSRGNAVDPWDVIGKYGADALRWYFFTVNDPGDYKLFDEKHVAERMRGFLGTFWNCVVFWNTYSKKQLSAISYQLSALHILDRWVLSTLNGLIGEVREKLDAYDITGAARAIERVVVDDLSQWYVRRGRERLQKDEKAMEVFKNVLEAVAKLVAPFVPFVAEAAWEELTTNNQQPTTNNKESIHLEDFPVEGLIDEKVLHVMEVLRGEVTAGLAQRAAQRIKIRQPLQSFTSALLEHALKNFPNSERKEFTRLLAEELNVKEIRYGKEMALDTVITEELRLEGEARELMRTIQDARKKAGLKPGEEIVLTVGDTESKRLLDHPVHGHAICAKTSVKNWAYREGAPLSVSVDA